MVKTIDSGTLKTELLGMQRWEDEGGQTVEGHPALPDPTMVRPQAIHARRHTTSLRWNEGFVIRPFQPGHGMILKREQQEK